MPGQAFAALGRGLDRLDGARQFRIEQALEGLRIAADDHQQIVEVVRDAAGQFADGFHLLRGGELFARFDELLLGVAPLGGVADDIGKPDQRAVVVADRGQRAGHEERRAVFADAPALDLVLAVMDGGGQRALRLAGAALVGPVEDAEMLADHLVGLVADDVLRAGIPARHAAGRVEQEDRVVGDAFHEDLEMPLGVLERQLRLLDAALQLLLRRQQAGLDVAVRHDGGAEHERRQRGRDREREQEHQRIVEIGRGAEPRRDAGDAAEDQRRGRGVALVATQRRYHQRHDDEEADQGAIGGERLDRAAEHRRQRAEGEDADDSGGQQDADGFERTPFRARFGRTRLCHFAKHRRGRAAPQHDDGRDDEAAAGIGEPPGVVTATAAPANWRAHRRSSTSPATILPRMLPAMATAELMTATGPKQTSAKRPMPRGLAKVLRPCDQRSSSQAPASAPSVVPSAIAAASTMGRSSTTPDETIWATKQPTKIAGATR